ncbi:MAG: hypothetical protein DDT22_00805 [candidate division WS2 bacterium]|nr:hypothetical protein [Candidatus Lithacetigena glycinireducens]
MNIDKELLDILACPIDHNELTLEGNHLVCSAGHRYPMRDNIPIMLIEEANKAKGSPLTAVNPDSSGTQEPDFGMPDPNGIDWFVNRWVAATNGRMFLPLIGKLPRYPIPKFPFAKGSGNRLLDLGCSWGRWCISASIAGYKPVGVDLSFEALQAAKRVAKQLAHEIYYVVADVRKVLGS